jgi:hypothetical protein
MDLRNKKTVEDPGGGGGSTADNGKGSTDLSLLF